MIRPYVFIGVIAAILPFVGGCVLIKKPSKANIDLRKKNQELQSRVEELEHKSAGDAAMIRGLQEKSGVLPTLPHDRLAKLFTTHDLKLGKLTGGADLDPQKPGDEGLKVYATPVDETEDPLKAAGAFTVEAFDTSRGSGEKIGEWSFDVAASRKLWSSVLGRHNYVLTCPWQQNRPAGGNLHLKITFVDELTQAKFEKTIDVKVDVGSQQGK
jgi:hypothetical protein